MVKITNREEFEPCPRLRLGAMNEFIGSGRFVAKTAWDLIDHHGGVADGIVTKLPANLLFSDKSSCHGDNGMPYALNNDVGFVEQDPFKALPPITFLLKSV